MKLSRNKTVNITEEIVLLRRAKRKSNPMKHFKKGSIAGAIKEIHDKSGISQRRLNDILGINSSGYIANVYSGNKYIAINVAVIFASMCGFSKEEKIAFYELVGAQYGSKND